MPYIRVWLVPVPLFFIQGGISVSTFQRVQPKWQTICVLSDPPALLPRRGKILCYTLGHYVSIKPQHKTSSKGFLSFLMGKLVFQDPPKMWFFTINKASSLLCHCSSVYFQTIQISQMLSLWWKGEIRRQCLDAISQQNSSCLAFSESLKHCHGAYMRA